MTGETLKVAPTKGNQEKTYRIIDIIEKKEKLREKERKREKTMSRVNYYQSALNSQKEKLNILAKMLEI